MEEKEEEEEEVEEVEEVGGGGGGGGGERNVEGKGRWRASASLQLNEASEALESKRPDYMGYRIQLDTIGKDKLGSDRIGSNWIKLDQKLLN
uniref:Uncharacterized protein n=1 Tax=Vespula pensylvanica TaxID=30213 RepID=A0A834PEM6_VESPE|nr:hypothetical protein H0235_000641 [Vespula pensylvanica]